MDCAKGHLGKPHAIAHREPGRRVAVVVSARPAAGAILLYRQPWRSGALELWLVALCCFATAPGCTVCRNGFRTIVCEPAKYCPNVDRIRSRKTYYEWAEQEWRAASASCSSIGDYVEDYAVGFESGFVDYVELGGVGEPPPVPPRKYWKVAARSGAGKERAAQWFAGYRHGAHVAMDGEYRQLATLQSSLIGNMYSDPLSPATMNADALLPGPTGLPQVEELPLLDEAGSPFQDDLPAATQPPEGSDTESGSEVEGAAPATTDDVEKLNGAPTSQVSSDVGKAIFRDELQIEQITRRARTSSRLIPVQLTPSSENRATSGTVAAAKQEPIDNGDGAAESSLATSAEIRIISTEETAEKLREASHSD